MNKDFIKMSWEDREATKSEFRITLDEIYKYNKDFPETKLIPLEPKVVKLIEKELNKDE